MDISTASNPIINLYPSNKTSVNTAKNIVPEDESKKSSLFNSSKSLLSTLKNLYQQQKPAIIDLDNKHLGIFYLNPKANTIYIRTSNENIKNICKYNLSVNYREIEEFSFNAKKLTNVRVKVHLDRFIWMITLVTSRTHLPKEIDTNKSQLSLKYWPNLSRYKHTSDVIRLAAFFSQTPTSASMAVKMLGCKTQDVYAFINACYALDILQVDKNESFISNMSKQSPSQHRSLLSGILHRLMGK